LDEERRAGSRLKERLYELKRSAKSNVSESELLLRPF
jgi:hypothetical protein